MSTLIIIAAATVVLSCVILISACIASSRLKRVRQMLAESYEPVGPLALARVSDSPLMNEWRFRQYQRLARVYGAEEE